MTITFWPNPKEFDAVKNGFDLWEDKAVFDVFTLKWLNFQMRLLVLNHCADSSNRNKDSLAAEAVVHVIIIISQTLATILTRRQMIFLAIASCY